MIAVIALALAAHAVIDIGYGFPASTPEATIGRLVGVTLAIWAGTLL